jgi:secreted trypsin-like serine protease
MLPVRRSRLLGVAAAGALAALILFWVSAARPHERDGVVAIVDARIPGTTLVPGFKCAGVVLSSTEVLTAAHCVDRTPIDALRIGVGGPDICAPASGSSLLTVDGVQIAEAYEAPGWAADIAVLTLASAVDARSIRIGPRPSPGARVLAYGWAGEALSDLRSCRPRSVELAVLADAECEDELGAAATRYDRSSAFCASGVEGNTCKGDSGGPVFSNTSNHIVGIVSWGVGCRAHDVGVYALPIVPVGAAAARTLSP